MPALVYLAYLSLLVLGLLDNVRGPFFPEILTDLHLSGELGSAFFAVTSLFAFIGSWSSHALVRRRSSLSLMGVSSLLLGLAFAGIGRIHEFGWWLVACAFFGWAYGALNLAQNLMVFESSPAPMRRRYYSGLHSMYGLAALLAPLTASLVRWLGFTWRDGFMVLGLLPIVMSAFCLIFRERKVSHAVGVARLSRAEWVSCLLFSFLMAGYLWGEISVSTRLVLWLRDERGFSPDLANFYLSGFFLTLLGGRLLFSFVHFARFSNWFLLWLSAGLSALTYLLALRFSALWILAVGLTMAPFFPLAMDQVSNLFRAKSAEALGFILGSGSLSIVVMHLLIGYCTDRFGVGRALQLGPLSLFGVFTALSVLLWRALPSRTGESKSP